MLEDTPQHAARQAPDATPVPGVDDKPVRRSAALKKAGEVRRRERLALDLRKAGATFQAIADQLGLGSANSAHELVKRALSRIPGLSAEEVRLLHVERLHHLLLAYWPTAQGGDHRSAQVCLSVLDRLAQAHGISNEIPEQPTHTTNVLVLQGDPQDAARRLQALREGRHVPRSVDEVDPRASAPGPALPEPEVLPAQAD